MTNAEMLDVAKDVLAWAETGGADRVIVSLDPNAGQLVIQVHRGGELSLVPINLAVSRAKLVEGLDDLVAGRWGEKPDQEILDVTGQVRPATGRKAPGAPAFGKRRFTN